VPDELESAVPYRCNIILQLSHGRVIQIKPGLDLGRRVLLAPNLIGERKVAAGFQQAMADAKRVAKSDVVEHAFRPDEVENAERLSRAGHVPDDGIHPLRKPTGGSSRLQPLDARSMALDCHDGNRGQRGELEGLSADIAPQIVDRGGFPKLAAKTEGSGGASAVAGSLTGHFSQTSKKISQKRGPGSFMRHLLPDGDAP
jgi:hypothetical protein